MNLFKSFIFCLSILVFSCKATNTTDNGTAPSNCSVTTLESEMDSILSTTISEVDFSFSVERSDGRRYTYNRGSSTMQTSYESASTSKLVSAVIILKAVQSGDLTLADKPQDHIPGWPLLIADPLYTATLENLLSFTSGLYTEHACLNLSGSNFETCVTNIANSNASTSRVPGAEFYYSGSHLQIAGLMAAKAKSLANWQSVFTEFKTSTGLFSTSTYDLPSSTNPRLAGGMHWTGDEYMAFLKALKSGSILNSAAMTELLADRTATTTMTYSPVFDGMSETWHYGFGLWHECQNATWNCTAGSRISSPGAYGAYPFWDREKNYFGLVARQGSLGTYTNGLAIERSVRGKVEEWNSCQ